MRTGLNATDLAVAKRGTSINNLQLGPGKDGVFPTTKIDLNVSNLSATQKAAVLAAIKTYTDDLDDVSATAILTKYSSEIDNPYISD